MIICCADSDLIVRFLYEGLSRTILCRILIDVNIAKVIKIEMIDGEVHKKDIMVLKRSWLKKRVKMRRNQVKWERVEINSDEAVERNEESCFEGQAVAESESQGSTNSGDRRKQRS